MGQLRDNFGTTLGLIWDNLETALQCSKDDVLGFPPLVTICRAYLCPVGSIRLFLSYNMIAIVTNISFLNCKSSCMVDGNSYLLKEVAPHFWWTFDARGTFSRQTQPPQCVRSNHLQWCHHSSWYHPSFPLKLEILFLLFSCHFHLLSARPPAPPHQGHKACASLFFSTRR